MSTTIDYRGLQGDLVRILRGKRSQAQLSELLGFPFNKVHFWEKGKTNLSWHDFTKFCEKTRAPLGAAMRDVCSYYGSLTSTSALVKHFMGENGILEYARLTGVSRYKIGRWVLRRSEPTLVEVLGLIERSTSEFYSFISVLCSKRVPEAVRARMELDIRCLALYEKFPWLSLLFCALETKGYTELQTHSDAYLAKRIGIGESSIREAMAALIATNLVVRKKGRYVPEVQRINIRGSADWRKKIVKFWNSLAHENFDETFGKPLTRHSFKIFNLSEEGFEKFLQAYTRFFNEVGLLINSEKTRSDRFFLMSMDLIDCDLLRKIPKVDGK